MNRRTLRQAMPEGNARTAFVLSGGGSLGAIQVGMLQALTEAGIRPDLLIGTSVGAVNAAFMGGEPDHRGALHLGEIWRGLRRQHRDVPQIPRIDSSSACCRGQQAHGAGGRERPGCLGLS